MTNVISLPTMPITQLAQVSWAPEFLQPWGLIMALLMVVGILVLSLALHRLSHWRIRRRELRSWPGLVDKAERLLRAGREAGSTDPLMVQMLAALRRDPQAVSLDRFHEQQIVPRRQPDQNNERWLSSLQTIATLLGLVGTVWGLDATFAGLSETEGIPTLKELGGPVASALRTTMYGAAIAIVCIAIRAGLPLKEQHRDLDVQVDRAWEILAEASASRPRGGESRTSEPAWPQADAGTRSRSKR